MIFIFQMGKVASIAVEQEVGKLGLPDPVLRSHFISQRNYDLADTVLQMLNGHEQVAAGVRQQLDFSRYCREAALAAAAAGRLKVITAMREPVSYIVASYFQNMAPWIGGMIEAGEAPEGIVAKVRADLVRRWRAALAGDRPADFLDLHLSTIFDMAERWFDDEMRGVLGWDIRQVPLAVGAPSIVQHGGMSVFFYRYEERGAALPRIGPFLGGSPIRPAPVNTAGEKVYAGIYTAFCGQPALPRDLVLQAYAGPTTRHVYAAEDIARFQERWIMGERSVA